MWGRAWWWCWYGGIWPSSGAVLVSSGIGTAGCGDFGIRGVWCRLGEMSPGFDGAALVSRALAPSASSGPRPSVLGRCFGSWAGLGIMAGMVLRLGLWVWLAVYAISACRAAWSGAHRHRGLGSPGQCYRCLPCWVPAILVCFMRAVWAISSEAVWADWLLGVLGRSWLRHSGSSGVMFRAVLVAWGGYSAHQRWGHA